MPYRRYDSQKNKDLWTKQYNHMYTWMHATYWIQPKFLQGRSIQTMEDQSFHAQ